jgi:hypothetical protein
MSQQGRDHQLRNIMSYEPVGRFQGLQPPRESDNKVLAEMTERVSAATAFGQLHSPGA